MIDFFLSDINVTQCFVFFSFFFAFSKIDRKNILHCVLLAILFTSSLTELTTFLCLYYKKNFAINYTISAIIQNSLWLFLLFYVTKHLFFFKYLIIVYVTFGIINLTLIQGDIVSNHFTFIFGALFYLIVFVFESFNQLKKENLLFFQSDDYLLIFSPVIFFLGYTLISAFNSSLLSSTKILGGIVLYNLIGYFINCLYYSLIIIYFYKQSKIKNV